MEDAIFEERINELVKEIGSMPSKDKRRTLLLTRKPACPKSQSRKARVRLQNSIDYLRVSIKYLLFDLEATRRENDYLTSLLKEDRK